MQPPGPDDAAGARTTSAAAPLTIGELLARCAMPAGLEEYSPLLARNHLLLDVAGADDLAPALQKEVAGRLRLLPVPVIALGKLASPLLGRGIDVLLPEPSVLSTVIRNIDAHPLAAMTLVQVLRHNEDVSAEQGLFAESLAYATLQGGAEFAQVLATMPATEQVAQAPGEPVLVSRSGDELHITLNRPDARNAYSTAMRDGLCSALQVLQFDPSLRRAVISGAGSCFCVGGDLREFGTATDTALAHAVRSTLSAGHLLLALAARVEFRLHRACVGSGIELPAFAARIVADNNTFIQLPEITLGLIPGAGGTVSIPRRIGRHRTAYLALSARRINAHTALQWGLVDALV